MLRLEQEFVVPGYNAKKQFGTTVTVMQDEAGTDYVCFDQDACEMMFSEGGELIESERVVLTRDQFLELAELVR